VASITKLKNGTRIIQFVLGRKRPTIRMGCEPMDYVEEVRLRVEHLAASVLTGKPPSSATTEWLKDCSPDLLKRLARAGLVQKFAEEVPRELGAFIDHYIAGRTDVKPRTRTNYKQARRLLVEYFGDERRLDTITPAEGAEWRRWMLREKKLGKNSIRAHARRAKQFLQYASDKRMLPSSPFAGMTDVSVKADVKKFRFVTHEESKLILAACPNAQWKLLFALGRYGGLRLPSEARELKWCDIDWEQGRMLVHSPKTEHQDKSERWVPLFPELRPYFQAAAAEAEQSSDGKPRGYVVTLKSIRNNHYGNVGTELKRIIGRTKVEVWPDLLRNLRRTRETELADHFPEHLLVAWIGNTVKVAREHYLRPTNAHFQRAANEKTTGQAADALHKALQSVAVREGHEWTADNRSPAETVHLPGNDADGPRQTTTNDTSEYPRLESNQ
jgi:integrase